MTASPTSRRSLTLAPLVCLGATGSSLTEHDDIAPGAALLGAPVWGPGALLANLEMRLGLPSPEVVDAVRVQRWARRLDELQAASPRFYAKSFATDRLGTATALLAMRDELVAAGWNGQPVPDGGDRLDTFAALEQDLELPAGDSDRLRAVETELESNSVPLDALVLAEPVAAWSGRWQRVFHLLNARGVGVEHVQPSFEHVSGDGDLARAQAALRGSPRGDGPLRGDGSFVLLRGETSWELASATAALLRTWDHPSAVIVRGGDVSALDGALSAHGLRSQGLDSPSVWRPMLQVLPLAIELAFEPRDPYRVLELLTLPSGPFDGFVGGVLARAVSAAPGIGGRPWQQAKHFIAERTREARRAAGDADPEQRARELLQKIEHWLELPGHSARDGAPRIAVLAVAERVIGWLRSTYAFARTQADAQPADRGLATRAAVTGAALGQAAAFHDALAQDTRDVLDLVDARFALEQVSDRHALPLVTEQAGRIDAVDAPTLLRTRRDNVVWWHCVAGTEFRPYPRAWRTHEIEALRAHGVVLSDPAIRLGSEAVAWRHVVSAARQRLVLVVPRASSGEALEPHPIVDDIIARLRLRDEDVARVTVEARALLAQRGRSIATSGLVPIMNQPPLPLPAPRGEWRVPAGAISPASEYSATSLEELLGCPLRSVLARNARIKPGSLASIPSGPLLHGKLAHRVVEELHRAGALTGAVDVSTHFASLFDRLVREEAGSLRRPGMTFELVQLRTQLERSLQALSALLVAERLRVVDVESHVAVEWRGGTLAGHIDLLLADETGAEIVLDLKWGSSTYRKLLQSGRSIQLAAYVASRGLSTNAARPARGAYFSLKQGKVLATEPLFAEVRPIVGPTLETTWSRLERSLDRIEAAVSAGRIPATGVSRSLPLLPSVGVEPAALDQHLDVPPGAGCTYCSFESICGKQWESFS